MKKRLRGKKVRRMSAVLLAASVMSTTVFPAASVYAGEEPVEFKIAGSDSIYEGMPLFDGVPGHLKAYLDVLCEYLGTEGMLRHALGYRGDYELRFGEHAGNIIPGSELFGDHVQGVSTDFPAMVTLGQSWNRALVKAVGDVIGTENLNTCDFLDTISNFNAVTCTALQDLRVNPLSGRFDEGFGEDAYLISEMVDSMATGASGIDEDENEEGFWTKAIVTSKHYTNYAAQSFRRESNVTNSIRGVMDQHARNIKKGIEEGAVGGFMTSYGRSAGIPNSMSPLVQWIQSFSPWGEGTYVVTDYSSDWQLATVGAMANDYDESYVPSYEDALTLLLLAQTGQGAANDSSSLEEPNYEALDAVLAELENESLGLTVEDIEKTARAQLTALIRCGVFNERDEEGYPVNYPFTSLSMGAGAVYDASNEESQEVALQAAQEGIVLLKNENSVLPLSKESSVAVAGPFADARFKTTYAVGSTPDLENAGLSVSSGMKAVAGEEGITVNTDGSIVALKASNGKYIVAAEDGSMAASAETAEEASKFEAYSWGQDDGYSYMCVDEGKNHGLWLSFSSDREGNISFGVVGTESLNVATTGLTATSYTSTLPSAFRVKANENGTSSVMINTYSNSFIGSEDDYYEKGRLLTVLEDGSISYSDTIGNAEGEKALRAEESTQFTIETVQSAGTLTADANAEYAVVVVGAPTRHSSGEGSDRSDLYLGKDQYELVNTVSAAYPGKTIVVISSSYPVIAEEFQNNENVAAILYVPYAGQYDGYAAGRILYGDTVPSGKLTSTWYADMTAFPEVSETTVPTGTTPNGINSFSVSREGVGEEALTMDDLDPRTIIDVNKADAAASGLTYQYTSAPVTYEFGYGLSYTSFEYGDLAVSEPAEDGSFTATIPVTNTGDVDGAEIVELYMSNPESSYGDYAPKKRLVSFEKVSLAAGETKEVSMTVEAETLTQWNTNSDSYEIEAGTYTVEAGASSNDVRSSVEMEVAGKDFEGLDITENPVYVYDRSFAASSDITYQEYSKAHTAKGLKEDALVNGYSAVIGNTEDSWVGLNGVSMDNIHSLNAAVAYMGDGEAVIEIHADAPDGEMIGAFTFGATKEVTYTVDAVEDYEVHELGYENAKAEITTALEGNHELYLVFKTPGARIHSIQGIR